MKQLTKINNFPKQNFTCTLENGEIAYFDLRFSSVTNAWFTKITYQEMVIDTVLTLYYNILSQYKNVLPFGLYVGTTTGYPPLTIDDFVNGNNSLYLLEGEEKETARLLTFRNENIA